MKRLYSEKLLSALAALLLVTPLCAQERPRLIVRADDMGSFRSANIACLEGYKSGIETSIEVMVVTAWFPEAVRLLRTFSLSLRR